MTTIVIEGGIIIEQGIEINVNALVIEAFITTENSDPILAENGDNLVT